MVSHRQTPETLLQRAIDEERKARRGKLKIYLGAAPGVGKTYEMLHDALEKRAKDLDVVVGVVESHGRYDIEVMLEKFEELPRQIVDYHGKSLPEFSLEKALQRNPGLILMDEMAHTNVAGLRHSKRWQDINELLDRGIDVYTTLNVQHIESLKDVVAQIIKAPIKETVPNVMIEQADAIELVDLPPEDLLKRLHDGKIYIPEQAKLAVEHYFRKGNLIALRELALRIAADHVGVDVMHYRQGEGIKQIWPTKDKILVCVGSKSESRKLIRAAKRIASGLQAEWIAVFIDTPTLQASVEKRNCAIENLRLAELLGAETHVLTGFDVVKEILAFAHEQNVTQIMIRKPIITRWRDWFRSSLADKLLRQSGEIDVYIMTGEEKKNLPDKSSLKRHFPWQSYGVALSIVVLGTVVNTQLFSYISSRYLVLTYVVSVIIVAMLGKIGPSIFASLLSAFAYNFFFIFPFYSFVISNREYFFLLVLLLVVTQLIIYFIVKAYQQAEKARFHQQQTISLFTLSRQLTRVYGVDAVLELGSRYIANVFNSRVIALIPKAGQLEIRQTYPSNQSLDVKERSIAEWVYEMNQRAGLGTDTLSFSHGLYIPILAPKGSLGVLRIEPNEQQLFTPEQQGLLDACINQIALVLEVERLQENIRKKELKTEADRARNALFKAMSEDIGQPLRTIIDAVSNPKIRRKKQINEEEQNFYWEINNLSRLNTNMSLVIQLESLQEALERSPASLEALVDSVLQRSSEMLYEKRVHKNFPADTPLVPLNKRLIHELFFNLIDNAVKFSPIESPITIAAHFNREQAIISVEDAGPGVLPEEKEKIFEKFYRGKQALSKRGIGLGLSICHKIVMAHGGRIWVENNPKSGASFCFSLPLRDYS